MNYSRKDLADALSKRYVLGTLRGSARKRFERLLKTNFNLRAAVQAWEELLAPLAWSLQPIQPSDLVLPRIMRKIKASEKNTLTQSSSAWKWPASLSAAMAALAVISSIGWWNSTQQAPRTITERVVETLIKTVPETADVAVIRSKEGQALWVARVYPETGHIDVQVHKLLDVIKDKDYELWALTAEGTPVSLGLLPKASKAILRLDAKKLEALTTTATLAVSLEPLGGSPKLVPTGPVLYTAALL